MGESRDSSDTDAADGRELLRSAHFWAGVVLLVGFAALAAWLLSTPIDDAYISFRYLANWIRGEGLVFNPGEYVEGYSNLLWIVVLAVPAVLGAPAQEAGPILELLLAVGCLVVMTLGAEKAIRARSKWNLAAPLLLAVSSPFVFWIGKGMEVIFYTFLLLVFATVVLRSREREALRLREGLWIGLVAAAVALTRPEGLMAPGAVLAALVLTERGRRKPYLLALTILAGAVVGQFAFRLIYYGPFWPNTYYAKRLPLGVALSAGIRYLRQFAIGMSEREAWFYANGWLGHLPIWIACLVAARFGLREWRRLWPVALQMAALVAIAVYVGGDWMPGFRFLLPAIPLGCLLVAAGLRELAGDSATPRWRRILARALLLILIASEAVGLVCMVRSHEFERWRHHYGNYDDMAKWLNENGRTGSLVALSDIGIIAYKNPDLRFIDVLGLTDPHIASLPGYHYLKTDVNYVLQREPDYVLAMLFVWPERELVRPKTHFDAEFLKHVAAEEDYASVGRVRGWQEGLRGERWVLFEIYARKASAGQGDDEATTAGLHQ